MRRTLIARSEARRERGQVRHREEAVGEAADEDEVARACDGARVLEGNVRGSGAVAKERALREAAGR
jgi:hypothetical protein